MDNYEKHLELHSKIWDEPMMARMFGYWEYGRFCQKWYHWLKTGVWPKRKWVDGLLTMKNQIAEHNKNRWFEDEQISNNPRRD